MTVTNPATARDAATSTRGADDDLRPQVEIERAVLERARLTDVNATHGIAMLHQLVAEEVERWNADHKRGNRPLPLADPARVTERALRNLAGYGPLEPLLDDDDVWEIMINAPDGTFA